MQLQAHHFPSCYKDAFSNLDPENPYIHSNAGLFYLDPNIFGNNAFAYLPSNMECSTWSVTLLFPKSDSPLDYFLASGWKEIADTYKVLILFLAPSQNDWESNPQEDQRLITELDKALDNKAHFDVQRFCTYLVGYHKGAEAALRYAMNHPSSYAGIGLIGSFAGNEIIAAVENSTEQMLPYLELKDIPVPVYLGIPEITEPLNQIIAHFSRRNKVGNKFIESNDGIVRYQTSYLYHHSEINDHPVARIAIEINEAFSELIPSCSASAWKELHQTIRTSGIGPGYLHPYRTLDEWGVDYHETNIDGIKRHWYEYIPKRSISRKKEKPLVLFLHGGSQTGKSCLYANEWMNVAESRDFIFVAPTGTMRNFYTEGTQWAPHPAWNASRNPNLFDDEKFIRYLIEDICSRVPIDKTRIYVSGHSMGSAMTQRCALAMPDIFAAAASNSGVVTGGFMGDFTSPGVREDIPMPAIWIQMGEHDVGGGTLETNPKAERTVRYWIHKGTLRDFEHPCHYECGRYQTKIWPSKTGAPMLSFTTTLDKPHAISPQDAWFYYDEFFSKFSRSASGEILYLGESV